MVVENEGVISLLGVTRLVSARHRQKLTAMQGNCGGLRGRNNPWGTKQELVASRPGVHVLHGLPFVSCVGRICPKRPPTWPQQVRPT